MATEYNYVTKGGDHHVSVFSTEDKFLKSFGGKGKAKGEFQHPRSVNVNKDGSILIADTDKRSNSSFLNRS